MLGTALVTNFYQLLHSSTFQISSLIRPFKQLNIAHGKNKVIYHNYLALKFLLKNLKLLIKGAVDVRHQFTKFKLLVFL